MGLLGLIQHLLTLLRQKHRLSPNLSGNAVLAACNLLILHVSTGSTPIPVRGLALGGLPTKPEIIFVRLNRGPIGTRPSRGCVQSALRVPEHHTGRPLSIEHQHLDGLITALAAFSGILTETMVRGQSVALIGRRLERALRLSATLRATLLCGPSAATRGPPARGHAAGPGEPHHLPVPLPAGARSCRSAEAAGHGPGPSARAASSLACLQGHLEYPCREHVVRPVQSNEAYPALPPREA